MSWYADLSTETMVAAGEHVRAIGWLSSDHSFPIGETPAEFLARLRAFAELALASARALYFPGFGGLHTCELCEGVHGGGNFGVPAGKLLYVAPTMVVHYVAHHGYCPPAEFVAAVMASPLPGTPEYQAATIDFSRQHRQWWNAILKRQQAME